MFICRIVPFQDESRLARVKRVLAGSLLGRGAVSNRIFGTRLELIESYLDTGVPYVVHRLCSYIETYGFQSAAVFRLSGGSPRLAEKLRATFERRGDADLESAACPPTAATLLRQYLKELPQPVVPPALVDRLLHVHARKKQFLFLCNLVFCLYNVIYRRTKERTSIILSGHYKYGMYARDLNSPFQTVETSN